MPSRSRKRAVVVSDTLEYTMREWRLLRLRWVGLGALACLVGELLLWLILQY